MKKINFVKMSGAGNDFVVIDKAQNPGLLLDTNVINNLCNRRNGIGCDGVITVSDSKGYDFVMEYFNADGSTGSLCANGARCAIQFAKNSGRIKNGSTKFLSNKVPYSGEVLGKEFIKFNLNEPKDYRHNFKISAESQNINASFINTGSPHVIINIEDVLRNPTDASSFYNNIDDFPVFELGKEIRYYKEFAPGGTNVNFIQIKNDEILIRTYERGVEDETLACGTGSAASAVIGHFNYGLKSPVTLLTRGGEKLIVNFSIDENKRKNLSLTGPAKIVFAGEIVLE
jgi:diaminopimelate epimerase